MRTRLQRIVVFAVASALLAGLASGQSGVRSAEAAGWTQVGVAEADMTYHIGASQGGFGDRWRTNHLESQPIETNMYARLMKTSEGVHMNQRVKAFVFDNGQRKMAIVSVDVLGMVQMFHRAVAREVAKDPGIAWNDLLLVGTHTESGPSNGTLSPLLSAYADFFDEEFARLVIEQSVRAIRAAARDLEPVRFAAGHTDVDAAANFVFNSTQPPLVDRGLDVLRFDRMDGSTKGVLISYPGHFTISGSDSRLTSSDGPGYVERLLEQRIESEQDGRSTLVGYIPGTLGDSGVRGPSEENIYQSTEGRARILTDAAVGVLSTLQPSAPFEVASEARRFPPPPGHEVPNFPLLGYAPIPFMVSHSLHAQVFRIGDVVLAGVPGEPVTELGLSLRERVQALGFERAIPLSHANDWTGYIYTDEQYDKQQGRANQGAYGREQGWYVVGKLIDLAKKLQNPDYELGEWDRNALMLADDTLNQIAGWATVTATPVTGELRDAALVPNVVLECEGLAQPEDVRRFSRTSFAWRGGNNGADLPSVQLQRLRPDADPAANSSWETIVDAEGPEMHLWMSVYRVQPSDLIVPGDPGCNELLDQIYSVVLEPTWEWPEGTYRFVATGVFRTAPKQDESYRTISSPFEIASGDVTASVSIDGDDVLVRLNYPVDREGIRWRPRATIGGSAHVLLDGAPAGVAMFDPLRKALVLEGVSPAPGQEVRVMPGQAEDPWGNANGNDAVVVAG